MTAGEKIAKLREEYGYSQEDLAKITKVPINTVLEWESGAQKPKSQKLVILCQALGCALDYIIDDKPEESDGNNKWENSRDDPEKKELSYIAIRLLSYIAFLPVIGIIIGFIAGKKCWKYGYGRMSGIAYTGMLVSLVVTIVLIIILLII